jgi:hypothetical protein
VLGGFHAQQFRGGEEFLGPFGASFVGISISYAHYLPGQRALVLEQASEENGFVVRVGHY